VEKSVNPGVVYQDIEPANAFFVSLEKRSIVCLFRYVCCTAMAPAAFAGNLGDDAVGTFLLERS